MYVYTIYYYDAWCILLQKVLLLCIFLIKSTRQQPDYRVSYIANILFFFFLYIYIYAKTVFEKYDYPLYDSYNVTKLL